MPVNESEALIERICKRNFLSMWSFSNPIKSDGDEFCDALVVFGNTVIVISVKKIEYQVGNDEEVAFKRWTKKAVQKSAFQVNKAINYIDKGGRIYTVESKQEIQIPAEDVRESIGVIVAFGSQGEIPVEIVAECKEKRFIVVTEHGIFLTLRELNTISDIIDYWRKILAFEGTLIVNGHDGDLLAYFLTQGRKFPQDGDFAIIDSGFWIDYAQRPERHRKLEAEKPSLIWDHFIEEMTKDVVEIQGLAGVELTAFEKALRIMASENRVSRRLLAKAFVEFHEDYRSGKTRARFISNDNGVVYVFVGVIDGANVTHVGNEVIDRMHVARKLAGELNTVVGIGMLLDTVNKTEQFLITSGDHNSWTQTDQEVFDEIQRIHHCWEDPLRYDAHEDEYPRD